MESGIIVFVIVMVLWGSIAGLRHEHAGEIYLIWYLFSLFFCIFLLLHLVAVGSGVDLALALGPQWEAPLRFVYDCLTDLAGELAIVGSLLAVSIGPQLMAYILSGVSGSARPPQFVREITHYAILSLVKFLAVWSSIILSDVAARLLLGQPGDVTLVIQGLGLVTTAFAVADTKRKYLDRQFRIGMSIVPGCVALVDSPWLREQASKLHRQCIRHASGVVGGQLDAVTADAEWKHDGRFLAVTVKGPVFRWIRGVGRRLFPER